MHSTHLWSSFICQHSLLTDHLRESLQIPRKDCSSRLNILLMGYVIVKESKKFVMGKLRNLVHVKYSYDLDGLHYVQSYVLASGLGIIRRRNLSPGPNEIISILVEE